MTPDELAERWTSDGLREFMGYLGLKAEAERKHLERIQKKSTRGGRGRRR